MKPLRELTQVHLNLVAAATVVLLTACPMADKWVSLEGKVMEASGLPVANATIVVEQSVDGSLAASDTITSDSTGVFSIFANSAPMPIEIWLRVSHPGYEPFVKRIDSAGVAPRTPQLLVLRPR